MTPVRSVLLLGLVLGIAATTYAQRGGLVDVYGGGGRARFAPESMPDGSFTVCRIMYTSVRTEANGGGWRTDYPGSEVNLMTRMAELTRTRISREPNGRPNTWVVRLTDPTLFNCPYTVASDVGTMGLTQEEADNLRRYLLKGGFLWVDDFWGTAAWDQWWRELAKVFPPDEYAIEDVPVTDPIFHTLFDVSKPPQITSLQFWRGSGGAKTSERGADSEEVHFRTVRDKAGRMMVVMTHNSDVADSWERERDDPGFFRQYSPAGYAFGLNVVLHALTH